jgi:hypothetical protein
LYPLKEVESIVTFWLLQGVKEHHPVGLSLGPDQFHMHGLLQNWDFQLELTWEGTVSGKPNARSG